MQAFRGEGMKQIKLSAISNGTTIDHISPNKALDVLKVLKIEEGKVVTLGMNLESSRIGKKDLIMIEDKMLSKEEVARVSLIAPDSTINIISGNKVKEKVKAEIQDNVKGILGCINPNCITKKDFTETRFKVLSKKPLRVRCHYCERVMDKGEILNNIL